MITAVSLVWRRQLAGDLGLPRSASWAAVHRTVIALRDECARLRTQASRAERDRQEAMAFLRHAQLYWWQAGVQGEDPPDPMST